MRTEIQQISLREVLHFLGWHGSPLEPQWISTLHALCEQVKKEVHPRVIFRRFPIESGGRLQGTNWAARGEDARAWLASCEETVLFAAIESVCDDAENQLRREAEASGKYLTDRFSPGYGDMPLEQSKGICRVLSADKNIGLTVSQSGIMIPRKSVTAVMGISQTPVPRRPSGCEGCSARATCPLRRADKDE